MDFQVLPVVTQSGEHPKRFAVFICIICFCMDLYVHSLLNDENFQLFCSRYVMLTARFIAGVQVSREVQSYCKRAFALLFFVVHFGIHCLQLIKQIFFCLRP